MIPEEETIGVLIRVEHMKGLSREDPAPLESFIRGLEDVNIYDKNNNFIGKLGKIVMENGKVLGVEAFLYKAKPHPQQEE